MGVVLWASLSLVATSARSDLHADTPPGMVKMLPGFSMIARIAPGGWVQPVAASDDANRHLRSGELRIGFEQKSKGSLLTVESALDHPVGYHARLIIATSTGERQVPTTICAVPAGRSVFEQWPTVWNIRAIIIVHFDDATGLGTVCKIWPLPEPPTHV